MKDTREAILDTVEELIETRGYNGFSYNDIAERIGIRKASIHYHFATKAEAGEATAARYAERMEEAIGAALAAPSPDYWVVLDQFLAPFTAFADSGTRICLCGALGGEFGALPKSVQVRVSTFFRDTEAALARLFAAGRDAGTFAFAGDPVVLGKAYFCAFQGALIVQRATSDASQLRDCVRTLKAVLKGEA